MKRSYTLRVDRLEDRCVPSADPLLVSVDSTLPDPTPPPDDSSFVIDVYLIDPNDPSLPKPVDPSTSDSPWGTPGESVVPPIDDPFWAVSTDSAPPVDDTSFVIDVYLIDPNEPSTPTDPVDPTIPEAPWGTPNESTVPPIGDPYWVV